MPHHHPGGTASTLTGKTMYITSADTYGFHFDQYFTGLKDRPWQILHAHLPGLLIYEGFHIFYISLSRYTFRLQSDA